MLGVTEVIGICWAIDDGIEPMKLLSKCSDDEV